MLPTVGKKKSKHGDWRNGSSDKSTAALAEDRGSAPNTESSVSPPSLSKYSSGQQDNTLFWLIWALQARGSHTEKQYTHMTHSHKNKKMQMSTEYSRAAVDWLIARLYSHTTGAMTVKPPY